MDRGAPPPLRGHGAGRVRRGDRDQAGPARPADRGRVGRSRLEPAGGAPHAEFMEVRVFDSWVHEQDVRRALDRPGGSGNQASALSIDRVQGAMGFVVGKRAGCPDGHRGALRRRRARARRPRLHRGRAGRAGPRGRRRRGADRHPVDVEPRLRAAGLRPGRRGRAGGRRDDRRRGRRGGRPACSAP